MNSRYSHRAPCCFGRTCGIAPAFAALVFPLLASKALAGPDYPLALDTVWTYHLRQEVGPGVSFGDADAALADGNVLKTSVVARVTGADVVQGVKYTRVESTRAGRPWLTEWYRLTPKGLLLGQTFDADTGQATKMVPPQTVLSPTLAAGESWTWKAADAPVHIETRIAGPARVTVPGGEFDGTRIELQTTVDTGAGVIKVRQSRWFVPSVGYVRQETETRADDRLISKVALELEKFELGE